MIVCRKTKVGGYDMAQLRPPRFIGQPKVRGRVIIRITFCYTFSPNTQFVSPYSPHKAEGYALFLVSFHVHYNL